MNAGGAFGHGGVLLSADGKHVVVAAASTVRLYSSATGKLVSSLSGHKRHVTAVVLDHASNDKIYTASLDGTVKHWDFMSGQLLHSFTVGNPIHSMVIPAGGRLAYLQCEWVLEKAGKMLFLDLTEGSLAPYCLRLHHPSQYAVSPSGRFVATFFLKTVFVYSTERPALPPLKLYHTRQITCVAIDPTENRVAAGDSTGRILIWSDFKDQVPNAQKAPPAVRAVPATSHVPNAAAQHKCSANSDMGSNNDSCGSAQQHAGGGQQQQSMSYSGSRVADTAGNAGIDGAIGRCHGECLARLQRSRAAVPVTTLHWHAHPVGTLCFSSNGTLILSGGEEAVLVVWQLDSGHRTFLPRLGGALTCITRSAVDAACYVIRQADHTVRMVNTAGMKVEMSIHGMRAPPSSVTPLESTSAAVLAPGGGELVMPTHNSMLQFWDAAQGQHVGKLQVAPRNTVRVHQQDHLQGGLSGTLLEPHVSHVTFSSDGLVMATVDVRPNAGCLGNNEQTLRFWDRVEAGNRLLSGQEQPMYRMNTYLDDPHRGGSISSLAYHPSSNMAATTGSSGDIKVWVQQGPSKGRTARWRCQSVGSHTGGAMSAAAFSSDGSLLAAAAGDQVALWDPDSSAVISCLASPLANYASPLRKLCFIPNSPYLVGYTTGVSPSLIAWNIVTESVCWSYQLAVSAIAADPMGGLLAVAVLPKSSGANAQGGRDSHSNKEASEQAEGGAFSHGNIRSPEVQEVRHSMTVTQSDNHQAAAASAVFLLHAATGLPELSWNLEQSVAAALLFPLPGTQLHASSVPLMPDGLSAFMIVLQDRQYAIARSANCMHNIDMQAMFLKQRQESSTFEAGFGKAVMLQLAEYGPGSAVLQSEGQGRFQMVFNAPSHVLPSLADLAPTFFDCFVEHSIFAGV